MNAVKLFALALGTVIPAAAGAADPEPVPRPISVHLMMSSFDRFVAMQVDYCLRNAPELTEELVLAHTTYSQASGWAAEILGRKYSDSAAVATVRILESTDSNGKSLQLRSIQSRGPAQCVDVVRFMYRATGESLAKDRAGDFESMLKRIRHLE